MRNSISIKNKKIFRENFIVCIGIIFIFLVTCYIKKIFPFGNFTVDTSDFEGQIVPFTIMSMIFFMGGNRFSSIGIQVLEVIWPD